MILDSLPDLLKANTNDRPNKQSCVLMFKYLYQKETHYSSFSSQHSPVLVTETEASQVMEICHDQY
jgi:hypothetical protein